MHPLCWILLLHTGIDIRPRRIQSKVLTVIAVGILDAAVIRGMDTSLGVCHDGRLKRILR
jgi:hypothetical protein